MGGIKSGSVGSSSRILILLQCFPTKSPTSSSAIRDVSMDLLPRITNSSMLARCSRAPGHTQLVQETQTSRRADVLGKGTHVGLHGVHAVDQTSDAVANGKVKGRMGALDDDSAGEIVAVETPAEGP